MSKDSMWWREYKNLEFKRELNKALGRCHIRTAVSEACLSLYCPYPCRKADSLTGMELSILGEAQIEQVPRLLGKQAIDRICLGPARCCAWVVLRMERGNIRASLLPLWAAVLTLCDARKIRSGERRCTVSNFLNNHNVTVADSNERSCLDHRLGVADSTQCHPRAL
jgi:hypothetical protein